MHPSEDFVGEVFLCNECDFSTQYESNLRKHVKFTHEQSSRYFYSGRKKTTREKKEPSETTNEKNKASEARSFSEDLISCKSCDYQTKFIDDLKQHKKFHQKKNVKPFNGASHVPCSPEFNGDDKERSNGTELECEKCDRKFNHKDALILHMEYFHETTRENKSQ